jgi:hypothetical protein
MKKSTKAEMREWEVQSAMATLQRAQEIRKDSKLMADVKKEAKKQAERLMTLGESTSSPKKRTLSRSTRTKRKLKRK